jgi:hypothetical protein
MQPELIADLVLRIAAATAVALALAVVWYAPFGFGDAFVEARSLQRERFGPSIAPMASSLAALVVGGVALGILIRLAGVTTVGAGAWLGLLAAVMVGAAMLSDYLFSGRPLSLLAIQIGYQVAYFVLMGVLFAAW